MSEFINMDGLFQASFANIILVVILSWYLIAILRYHWIQTSDDPGQLPPAYPAFPPLIGNLITLLWDNERIFRRVTSYGGRPTAARVGILGCDIYLFQDLESIKAIWRASSLSSPIKISIYTFKYFFGVPEMTLNVYRADNSGPYRKPYIGSNIPEDRRTDYLVHHEFKEGLQTRIVEVELSSKWTEFSDFQKFFRKLVGPSLIESIFGPALLRLSPSVIDDLYEFDANVPWLARALPSFIMPQPYRTREKLVDHIRRWHGYAQQQVSESSINVDGDGDPYWGSAFIRNRHSIFSQVGAHDEDAVIALDLGLCFGLVSNTSPAAFLATWHIFKDRSLLSRIRSDLKDHLGTKPLRDVDLKVLLKIPLLESIYAEVLRLYTNIYVMVSSPQDDVTLGRWKLPRNSIALLNSSVSHRDAQFWNTRGGTHPVESFWADRFLTDPHDKNSGPINPAIRGEKKPGVTRPSNYSDEKPPFYSTDGLEASWFPYGGGYSICPGRHLAKSVIIFIFTILATEFDIEFLTDSLVLDKWRFGLGISTPTNKVPVRIRRRS
ncbi:cytochrome P450 [Xylaria sp. FL0064]|nr:cytochrome P450 [Xylaria sp. FL0064]